LYLSASSGFLAIILWNKPLSIVVIICSSFSHVDIPYFSLPKSPSSTLLILNPATLSLHGTIITGGKFLGSLTPKKFPADFSPTLESNHRKIFSSSPQSAAPVKLLLVATNGRLFLLNSSFHTSFLLLPSCCVLSPIPLCTQSSDRNLN